MNFFPTSEDWCVGAYLRGGCLFKGWMHIRGGAYLIMLCLWWCLLKEGRWFKGALNRSIRVSLTELKIALVIRTVKGILRTYCLHYISIIIMPWKNLSLHMKHIQWTNFSSKIIVLCHRLQMQKCTNNVIRVRSERKL